ncbi:MAG: Gfo/Idh/MocA family oxidoreductase [Planctomycetales bacterium]
MSALFARRDFLHHAAALSTGLATANLFAVDQEASAKQPRIKIGQIGVGHAHASKISAYRASPDYEVVGIAEADPELRRKAETQKEFQGLTWMSVEELLNFRGLQAVLVETKVRDLLDVAELCIKAGKHVHLDKPAGASLPNTNGSSIPPPRRN